MTSSHALAVFVGVTLTTWSGVGSSDAFDLRAHGDMTLRAIQASSLDAYLRDELRFGQGTNEQVTGRVGLFGSLKVTSVSNWMIDGSALEDSPPTRLLNHFHNPRRTWDQAELRPGGVPLPFVESAVRWAQDSGQVLGANTPGRTVEPHFFRR